MIKNKKGVTEVTTFILITLLIVVSSIIAYSFSRSLIEDEVAKMDRDNFVIYLKKMSYKLDEVQSFDSSTVGIDVNFNSGKLVFENNQVYYISLVEYNGDTYCFDNVCSQSVNGYERLYLNLSNSYTFEDNISLLPSSYLILFTNNQNESKIRVNFK